MYWRKAPFRGCLEVLRGTIVIVTASALATNAGRTTMLSRSSTVQATLILELLDSESATTPVHAELRYDSGDPFAVRGDFCLDQQVVRWVFARSLLRIGLYEPTGSGDVPGRPRLDDDGRAGGHLGLRPRGGS